MQEILVVVGQDNGNNSAGGTCLTEGKRILELFHLMQCIESDLVESILQFFF